MNFTQKIKQELISKKRNKEEIKALLEGVFCANAFENDNEIKIKIMNKNILNNVVEFLNKSNYQFELFKNSIIIKQSFKLNIKPKIANSYFAGIFISSGSISNINSSSYHFEIKFKDEKICDSILEFAKKHIHFHKIKNKNYWVLYLKKNETISDFLQIIGAQQSYFEFIDSIIERDFKNQITKIFNLDLHNQNKLVDSNQLFLENLEFIKTNKLEHLFTKEQLIFYDFKKKNQFIPLSQLSEKLLRQKNIKITKSGLNHWLIKLRNICESERKK